MRHWEAWPFGWRGRLAAILLAFGSLVAAGSNGSFGAEPVSPMTTASGSEADDHAMGPRGENSRLGRAEVEVSAAGDRPSALMDEDCDEFGDFFLCDRWPNLLLRPPSTASSSGAADHLIFLDRGGPGVDNLAFAPYLAQFIPMDFGQAWLAILVENWNTMPASQECSEAVDRHMAAIRRSVHARVEEEAGSVASACGLATLATDLSDVARQLTNFEDVADLDVTGAIGASFGATRLKSMVSAGARFDATLVDSPFDASDADATIRLATSVEDATRTLVETPWYAKELLMSPQITDADLSVPFVDSDLYLSLYAASLTPDANAEWAKRVYGDRIIDDDDVASIRSLADAVLRHEGFDRYSDSWAGHLAEYCAHISDGRQGASESEEAGFTFEAYFTALYSPCYSDAFLAELGERDNVGGSVVWGCVVVRDKDPVASPVASGAARMVLRVDEQNGHIPFTPSVELDGLMDEFWSRCVV